MSAEEIRTLLVERAQALDVTRPDRVDEVFGRIRSRRRRRTTLGVAVACCVALALILGLSRLTGYLAEEPEPVAPPTPNRSASDRDVAYSHGYSTVDRIQYGNRTVDIGAQLTFGNPGRGGIRGVVHMDLTDDGVVFSTSGGGIWFTDGFSTRLIGETEAYIGLRATNGIVTGTSGSLAAWISEGQHGTEVVVYDTAADRVVARVSETVCDGEMCEMSAIVGNHVYWVFRSDDLRPALTRLDVPTERKEDVTNRDLTADLAAAPRGLILGDTPETGIVGSGYGTVFAVEGDQLVPMSESPPSDDFYNFVGPGSATDAFETSTRAPIRLTLPPGHDTAADEFTAFAWLADDRLALMNAANSRRQATGEILDCPVPAGQCELVAAAPPENATIRIAPHLGLPG